MPERPLDCSECKKPLHVCYTEIVGDKMTRTVMCAIAPILKGVFTVPFERRESVMRGSKRPHWLVACVGPP